MPFLADLLESHQSLLDDGQISVMKEFLRRQDARQSFAYPEHLTSLEAQSGFIRFERVFCTQPMNLFGQDSASLAHTLITIYRATGSGEGDMEVGEPVFSARMSEKSLTEAVLLSNRGRGHPMTVTRLGDLDLPDRPKQQLRATHSAEVYTQEQSRDIAQALDDLDHVISNQPKRPTPELREATQTVGYKARDLMSTSFPMTQHLESMGKLRSEILTEAAHAALHSEKVGAALSRQLTALPAPEPMNWFDAAATNPMVDQALDALPSELHTALRILIVAEIKALAADRAEVMSLISLDEDGVEIPVFPSDRDLGSVIGWDAEKKGVKAPVNAMKSIWNWADNPHIAESREKYNPGQACLSATQMSGWMGHLHSSLPPTDGSYFSLEINSAWEQESLGGNEILEQHNPLVKIEIAAEDLMTALRGHPEGLPTPCSVYNLCGIYKPRADRPTPPLLQDISDIDKAIRNTPEVQALIKSIDDLNALVSAKRSGKAWLSEVADAAQACREAFKMAQIRVGEDLSDGRGQVEDFVVQSANQILASIAKSLPSNALEVLRLK